MKEQADSDNMSKFASRLAEERRRVCPHQGTFAERIGISQGRQSLYERGERELRADYLSEIAKQRIDVGYILTGSRSPQSLDPETSAIASTVSHFTEKQRTTLLAFLATIAPGASKSD